MQVKVALLFVGLLALASGKPSLKHKDPRGLIATIGDVLVKANELVADALAKADQAIDDIQANVDVITENAKAAAASAVAAGAQTVDDELAQLQEGLNADAAKVIQCGRDQQATLVAANNAANNAVIDSLGANLNGVGDSLKPVIADLQTQNQALNAIDNQLAACESADDPNSCALDVLTQIANAVIDIPANIEDSVNGALDEVKAAAEQVKADTLIALGELQNALAQVLNDIGTCAAS